MVDLTQIRSDFDNGIIVSKQTLLALVDYAIELEKRQSVTGSVGETLLFGAKVIELFDDATMRADYMIDASEAAGILRSLPSYLAKKG